jgi:RHS repeat-associated protein
MVDMYYNMAYPNMWQDRPIFKTGGTETSQSVVFLMPVEYTSYGLGTSIKWKKDEMGDWMPHYAVTDHLGNVVMTLDACGEIETMYEYTPFGEALPLTHKQSREKYIGKETDFETGFADHGVRKYSAENGLFTCPDVLWEKYCGWSPYHYCVNNPILWIDDTGYDKRQRQMAIEFMLRYQNSGTQYDLSSKGLPGSLCDCSGAVSHSMVYAGEEDPGSPNKKYVGTGVQRIEAASPKTPVSKVQPGNAVTFRTNGSWGFHVGLVTEVNRDESGVTSVVFQHISGGHNGWGEDTIDFQNSNCYWNKSFYGFWKWDRIPDAIPPFIDDIEGYQNPIEQILFPEKSMEERYK